MPPLYDYRYTAGDLKADVQSYEEATTPEVRQRLRDKMIFSVAKEIDRMFAEWKNEFYGERAVTDTVLDVVNLGLTSAATFASGGTSQILAAAATGVAGSRLSFSKNVLKEKTPEVLLGRMDGLRSERWSVIYQKTIQNGDAVYSWYQADRDLVAYYQAGTLEEAIQAIAADSGAQQKEAQREIEAANSRYGVRVFRYASPETVADVHQLFERYRAMPDPAKKTACGDAILAAYASVPAQKALLEAAPFSGLSTEEQITMLQIEAEQDGRIAQRTALRAAYVAADAECR